MLIPIRPRVTSLFGHVAAFWIIFFSWNLFIMSRVVSLPSLVGITLLSSLPLIIKSYYFFLSADIMANIFRCMSTDLRHEQVRVRPILDVVYLVDK